MKVTKYLLAGMIIPVVMIYAWYIEVHSSAVSLCCENDVLCIDVCAYIIENMYVLKGVIVLHQIVYSSNTIFGKCVAFKQDHCWRKSVKTSGKQLLH